MFELIDTGALVALASPNEKDHRAATAYFQQAAESGTRFVVGRPVLVEYLDGVTKRVSKAQAIKRLRLIEASSLLNVEADVDEDHVRARELFLKYDDHEIDMTDALSFAIAERFHIRRVFTYDSDFAIHGFEIRP